MPKYIDADKFLAEESEAYMSAQSKITDSTLKAVNEVVHKKIQMLIADAPDEDVAPVRHGEWIPYGLTKKIEPFFTDEYMDVAVCQGCNKFEFERGTSTWGYKFCPECGQAIDWSKE